MEDGKSREVLLDVKNLCMHFSVKSRRKKTIVKAVDDVSFQVYRSETFGLIGESGCGKTTTGRTILRLYNPTSGTITFGGKEISGRMTSELRKYLTENITCIFQDPIESLNSRMTVREIIGEGLSVRGIKDPKEIDDRVYEVLEKVGLTREHANRYPHEFSGGQRQRIGIARAIIVNPAIVIADEPVSALDVSVQAQVINLLNELKQEYGLTIIFVAHNLSVVKYFSDRIGVMYRGKLVEVANSDDHYEHPLHPYTKSLLSAIPMPNPLVEKDREVIGYDAATAHDYSVEKPSMVEILPEHFVYASESEARRYREELKGVTECMKMALGENPKGNYGPLGKMPATRMGETALIRETLYKAMDYRDRWLACEEKRKNGESCSFSFDLDLHSLMRVFDGLPVKIHVHKANDIMAALRIGKEFHLNFTLEHCTEGYMLLDELREAGVIPMEGLLMQAAILIRHGLSEEGAYKALTVNAAKAIGLWDRIGSIEPGKQADLVIWNQEPFTTKAKAGVVIVDGTVWYWA